jgi:hypothetical protein
VLSVQAKAVPEGRDNRSESTSAIPGPGFPFFGSGKGKECAMHLDGRLSVRRVWGPRFDLLMVVLAVGQPISFRVSARMVHAALHDFRHVRPLLLIHSRIPGKINMLSFLCAC